MAKRSFKGYRLSSPVEIELESPDGERRFTARCVSALPGSVFLEMAEGFGGVGTPSPDGDSLEDLHATAGAATAIFKVLKMAIVPEDWPTFKAFIDEPTNGITVEILAEITGYLSEQYTGNRPPTPAPSSLPG